MWKLNGSFHNVLDKVAEKQNTAHEIHYPWVLPGVLQTSEERFFPHLVIRFSIRQACMKINDHASASILFIQTPGKMLPYNSKLIAKNKLNGY